MLRLHGVGCRVDPDVEAAEKGELRMRPYCYVYEVTPLDGEIENAFFFAHEEDARACFDASSTAERIEKVAVAGPGNFASRAEFVVRLLNRSRYSPSSVVVAEKETP